jgi:hypothetical protein
MIPNLAAFFGVTVDGWTWFDRPSLRFVAVGHFSAP